MFKRALVHSGADLPQAAQAGEGYLANPRAASMSADAASTISIADLSGGLILRSGATAARIDTSPTGTLLDGAYPNMDEGDSLIFKVSVQVAFAITMAGGVGVTASGNLVIAANTYKEFVLTKTGTATYTLVGL